MRYQFDFASVLAYWPWLWEGVQTTLTLTLITTVLGVMLGAACALLQSGPSVSARRAVGYYVEFIRNTPLLIQAYFLIFGIARLGIPLPIFLGAALALTINVGAYTSEIMRAGIESIHKGQIEAAECLGLSRMQLYIHIVLWPAIERVYPALTSQYVLLMLASSIMSSVGVEELFGMANRIQSETFRNFEVFVAVGVIYFILSILVRMMFALFGALFFVRRRRLGTPL